MTGSPAGRPPVPGATGAGELEAVLPRLTAHLPEPGHLWIRYAPKAWEGPGMPWLDLAAGRLGRSNLPKTAIAGDQAIPEPDGVEAACDDLVYLPPVPERLSDWRDRVAERTLAAGTPVLVQLLPGDATRLEVASSRERGAVIVLDLLAPLLPGGALRDENLAASQLGSGAVTAAAWPLLPGITDDPDLWERACERLADAGLKCVQAVTPAFARGDRRRLAQGQPEEAFAALFHREPGQPPPERDFARAAWRHGLAPFLPRPLPRGPRRLVENRRIAGQVALAAELWLRLGRPVGQAQALFRAARWLDATDYDVGSLAREGNLGVVTALDALARRAVAEAAAGSRPALTAELEDEYLAS